MSESDKAPKSKPDNIIQFPLKAKTIFTKAEKAYVITEKATILNKKQPPKRTKVENPLTKQQKNQLNYLVKNKWVSTSNLAERPINYGRAWNLLYEHGLDGAVNGIEQIEQSEFQQCVSFIQQRIRILETVGNKRVMRRKFDYRDSRIAGIHARCNELGISDEIRRDYQLYRFKKRSMKDFTDDELEEYYEYVMHGTPKFFIPKKVAQPIQKDRENTLLILLDVLEREAIAKGQQFNRLALSYGKEEFFAMLQQLEPALFNIEIETFEEFWKEQKHCRCRKGPKPGQSARR